MFAIELDLSMQTSFLISFAMVTIGTAFFGGFDNADDGPD